jgi:hypothetical protein
MGADKVDLPQRAGLMTNGTCRATASLESGEGLYRDMV